jgi:transposase
MSTPQKLVASSRTPGPPLARASRVGALSRGRDNMQVVYERCAGIDVHKKTAVVTLVETTPDGQTRKQTRTFSTMTADLLRLEEWLGEQQVEHVAMESTGVYWWPVYNLLEEGRNILLVNPQHMRAVPGRKTDVKESEWLADLLRARACSRPVASRPSPSASCAS